jgi:hypothetical protein
VEKKENNEVKRWVSDLACGVVVKHTLVATQLAGFGLPPSLQNGTMKSMLSRIPLSPIS